MIYLKSVKWTTTILLLAFIMQMSLISVNYKRAVLEEYVSHNGLSDIDYLFSMFNLPYYVQTKQLVVIGPKNLSKLNNYQPHSPWKKEIRTASSLDVLNSSIEKNSINFWWVRIFHWKVSNIIRMVGIFILIFGVVGFVILSRYVKSKII